MKLFKIIFLFCILNTLVSVSVHAANGEIIQPVYSTDILTFMDGIPIQGYAIDGKMLICLEDLESYGFDIYYSDEARTLFVNKKGSASTDFYPIIERGTVGETIGYTYETDIKAVLNGSYIHAENIGGKLAAAVEDLDDIEMIHMNGLTRSEAYHPKYFMTQSYSNDERVLMVYSDMQIPSLYERNIALFKSENEKVENEIIDVCTNELYTQYIYRGGGRDVLSDDSLTVIRFYKSGRIIDYSNVLMSCYRFVLGHGCSIYDANFSDDGKYLIFNAVRTTAEYSPMGIVGYRNVFEQGDYKLNLDTTELIKA